MNMDMENNGPCTAEVMQAMQRLEGKVDNLQNDLSKAMKTWMSLEETKEPRHALYNGKRISHEVAISSNQTTHTATDDGNDATAQCSSRGHLKKPLKRSKHDHKQTCLKKALQMNIVKIVDSVHFAESGLQDMLISSDCMTEDETNAVVKQLNRKDQVRHLMRLVKGRSHGVMSKFLGCLKKTNPELAEEIGSTYLDILRGNITNKTVCTFCNLKQSVELRLIADYLWAESVITESLYDNILTESFHVEELWSKLSEECGILAYAQKAIDIICAALNAKGHYKELSDKLRRKSKLECCCSSDRDRNERNRVWFIPGRIYRSVKDSTTASPASSRNSEVSIVSSLLSSEGEQSAVFLIAKDKDCELTENLAHHEVNHTNVSLKRCNTL